MTGFPEACPGCGMLGRGHWDHCPAVAPGAVAANYAARIADRRTAEGVRLSKAIDDLELAVLEDRWLDVPSCTDRIVRSAEVLHQIADVEPEHGSVGAAPTSPPSPRGEVGANQGGPAC